MMKPTPDREQLLNDVLNEDADLRATSLETLLLAARRRRHARRRNRALLLTGLAVGGIITSLWSTHRQLPIAAAPSPSPAPTSTLVVESAPLSAGMWVQTTSSSVEIIASSTDSNSVLETPRGPGPSHEINDGELFALLAGRAAAIVRLPTGPAELLVLEK